MQPAPAKSRPGGGAYDLEKMVTSSLVGLTIAIFFILILFPLFSLYNYAAGEGMGVFLDRLVEPNARKALALTIKVAASTTLVNLVVGTAMAFLLVRSSARGKSVLDALVDIPLAIPTVVIGFALLLLYGPNGPIGKFVHEAGLKVMFSFPGILLAHVFVTFPFMVRAVGTALEGLDTNYEKAAKTLGASSFQTFIYVTLPSIRSGLIAGSVLTFAKSLGEFGATLMVSGNLLGRTQTGPLYIYSRFNMSDLEGASAIALVLAAFSFLILFVLKMVTAQKSSRFEVDSSGVRRVGSSDITRPAGGGGSAR